MTSPTIAIVDYRSGNLRSVQKALESVGAPATITGNPRDIDGADAVVFPGQGTNDQSMRELKARRLVEPIKNFVASGRPFLGVCLGLQLLMESSDEGVEPCLGILPGRVRRLPAGQKVPHMGWNQVHFKGEHPVLEGVPKDPYFYFVHSYYADPEDGSVVIGTTGYGTEFCSVAARDNLLGVQFHPEKSGELGLLVYRNFVKLVMGSTVGSVG